MKATHIILVSVSAVVGVAALAGSDVSLTPTLSLMSVENNTMLIYESTQIDPVVDGGNWTTLAIANLAVGYAGADGVWTGFDPGEHPSVAVYKSANNEVESALAINFPSPETLGDATKLSVNGTPFASLYRIDNITADVKQTFSSIPSFEFNANLTGVDSFVMIADVGDDFLNPASLDWVSTFLHEMFHRYQGFQFTGSEGYQDVENYAFDANNIALATLEERALMAAVTSNNATTQESAAKHFAAIRMVRLMADERVILDNDQERFEGTARYLEHRLAGNDTRFYFHDGNHGIGIVGDSDALLEAGASIKTYYAFNRFYATGSAVLHTLELLGVADFDQAVQNGKSPVYVLIGHFNMTQAETTQLVADARAAYDPEGELMSAAERAAKAASKEGPVFGDGIGGNADGVDMGGSDGDTTGEGDLITLTDEQEQCLTENGVNFTVTTIPNYIWEVCIGP